VLIISTKLVCFQFFCVNLQRDRYLNYKLKKIIIMDDKKKRKIEEENLEKVTGGTGTNIFGVKNEVGKSDEIL